MQLFYIINADESMWIEDIDLSSSKAISKAIFTKKRSRIKKNNCEILKL